MTTLGIATRYKRLLIRLLEILEEENFLGPDQAGWKVMKELAPADPEGLLKKLYNHPEAAGSPQLEISVRCGQSFADALTGKTDHLGLLFPDGSLELAARLYSESPEARVFNSMVREAVSKALESLPRQEGPDSGIGCRNRRSHFICFTGIVGRTGGVCFFRPFPCFF